MSDELQKIAWASTSGGASGGQAREPVLWEDGLLLRILGHDGVTAFDFPTLDLLGDLDGAASIGADDSGFSVIGGSTVQALLASIDAALGGVLTGVVLADGSVPFTGAQSLGGQNIGDVGILDFYGSATHGSITYDQSKGFDFSHDIYSGSSPWVDFSATMDLTGFSSTSVKVARYKMVGKLCFVQVHVIGTSNGLAVNFDVPASLGSYEDKTFMGAVHCQNGSDYSLGSLFSDSSWDYQINVQRTASPADDWASGSSKFSANFIFQADSIPS